MSHVFINGRFLGQPFSGVQRFSLSLVRALGALVEADAAARGGRTFTLLVPPGTPETEPIPGIGTRTVGRLGGQAWEQVELPLHARGGVLLSLGNTAPLAKREQIVTIHDVATFAVPEGFSAAFGRWYRFLIPRLGKIARRVVTVSHFSAGELARLAGVPAEKIRVVYNAPEHILAVEPDDAVLTRAGLAGRPYVLAVGNRAPYKNFQAVLDAQALLGETPYAFVHVGQSNARIFGEVEDDAARSAVALGRVSDAELRALYAGAGCFVFPSLYEGFGMPPLEAMACGCPVVAARAASMPEVCGDATLYFDPRDARELATRIAEVMGDAALREELARRGRERVKAFAWKSSARALLRVIDEVAPPLR